MKLYFVLICYKYRKEVWLLIVFNFRFKSSKTQLGAQVRSPIWPEWASDHARRSFGKFGNPDGQPEAVWHCWHNLWWKSLCCATSGGRRGYTTGLCTHGGRRLHPFPPTDWCHTRRPGLGLERWLQQGSSHQLWPLPSRRGHWHVHQRWIYFRPRGAPAPWYFPQHRDPRGAGAWPYRLQDRPVWATVLPPTHDGQPARTRGLWVYHAAGRVWRVLLRGEVPATLPAQERPFTAAVAAPPKAPWRWEGD